MGFFIWITISIILVILTLGSYLLGSDSVLAWLVGLVLSFIIILQEFRINISEKDKTDENIIDDI
jgi:hypothetical protein